MRFRFVEEHRANFPANFPANRLCDVVGVSARVLRAFRRRPAGRRQRSDMVTLAHIKEQSRLGLDSYGRPRLTEELKEIGLDVGHRRVGRLMRHNGISVVWTREGWLYLAVILDLHSRRVIGWAVSNRMKRDLATRALRMAIAFRQPPKGCIHHTDRGSQY
ncbi:Integrase core domain protein [Pelagimonas varians]|uniref:Integrase core domain protein n=1 Tax=Pelagimonas varians TaxID=696760 RepID=A0A238L693_9RHOB|nr:Integrase core domain protein [Pelagimonas varians]